MESDSEKLRIVAKHLSVRFNNPTHTVVQTINEIADNVERKELFIKQLKESNRFLYQRFKNR